MSYLILCVCKVQRHSETDNCMRSKVRWEWLWWLRWYNTKDDWESYSNGSWNCWENRDQLEKGDSGDKWFYMVVIG